MFYTYRIDFVDGHYYFGYHCGDANDNYYGSPTTHREKWLTTMYSKTVLSTFENKRDAWEAEIALIKPHLNDPFCLNEHCGGFISDAAIQRSIETRLKNFREGNYDPSAYRRSFEVCSNAGKIGGSLSWWNNGVENTRAEQCPGDGWMPGRIVKWRWFNDGTVNVRSHECPEGFVPGRIMKRSEKGTFA